MADINFSPSNISQQRGGLKLQFPPVLFISSAADTLANIFSGSGIIAPNGVAADRFVFSLPRFTKEAKVIEFNPEFAAEARIINTVTAGLDPSVKLNFLSIRGATSADLILYDGRGTLNDMYVKEAPKYIGADSLTRVSFGRLSIVYNVRISDFAPNTLYAPSLAAVNFVRLYMQLNIHVQY